MAPLQAMDITGLSKLSADTITLIIAVLGFMVNICQLVALIHCDLTTYQTFGFATEEFEVTQDRLGVYLPVVRLMIFEFMVHTMNEQH